MRNPNLNAGNNCQVLFEFKFKFDSNDACKGIYTSLRSPNLNARKGCQVLFESSSSSTPRKRGKQNETLIAWLHVLVPCALGHAWQTAIYRHGRRSIHCVIVMVMNGNGRRWSCSCLVGTDRPTTISSYTGTGACHHPQHTYRYHRKSPTTDNIILTF